MSKTKRTRVPAALHSELTEYTSLLRVLRTRHALDLSAHLSQPPSRSSQDVDELEDESELSLPEEEDSSQKLPAEGSRDSTATTSRDTTEPAPLAGKKRKRAKYDTWTRWPFLAGDVYLPELSLYDEVQFIASRILKRHKAVSTRDSIEPSSSEDPNESDDEDLGEIATRALAASTAEYLRSLLSACSALVPPVQPSLRTRLAPLNWKSILSTAAANELVSPEALERVGTGLEALYGSNAGAVSVSDNGQNSSAKPNLPSSIAHHIYATRAVRAARKKLKSLLKERAEQEDGDFLSFVWPPQKQKERKKRARKTNKKEEIAVAKAKAGIDMHEKEEPHASDGEGSESTEGR